jgi:hypothetical protein
MKASRFRVWLSGLLLGAYLASFALLGLGMSQLWMDMPDAKQAMASIAPLFTGYAATIIGYFFAAPKKSGRASGRRRDYELAPAIAWLCLIGAFLVCGSVPLLLVLNFTNQMPFALLPNLLAGLAMVQSAMGALVGGLIAVTLARSPTE